MYLHYFGLFDDDVSTLCQLVLKGSVVNNGL